MVKRRVTYAVIYAQMLHQFAKNENTKHQSPMYYLSIAGFVYGPTISWNYIFRSPHEVRPLFRKTYFKLNLSFSSPFSRQTGTLGKREITSRPTGKTCYVSVQSG